MKNKVVIIGCGNVGMSYAYALLNQKTSVTDLVLIDIDIQRLEGEVMDLNHGLPFAPSKINIKVGDYNDCLDAAIVCICAGANQRKGETRLELIKKNERVINSIIDNVLKTSFDGVFLIATNPVDIMTYIVQKTSKFPKGKVIGSGTILDTARLRYLMGERLNINPKNVHAYVLGEHGDSEFVPWSNAFIGSSSVYEYFTLDELNEFSLNVKNAAYDIIERKGATYYGIGMVLVRITNAILNNESTILTISAYNKDYDIYIGMPSIVNKKGVVGLSPLKLTEEEQLLFKESANIIKNEINKL